MTSNKNMKETLDYFKALSAVDDLALTRDEKLELIAAITLRQAERWEHLRFFHSWKFIKKMEDRHLFMRQVIDLMRDQKKRLERLKKLV